MYLIPDKLKENALTTMQQLFERSPGVLDARAVDAIVNMESLAMLEWLYARDRKKVTENKKVFRVASTKNHEDIVHWLVGKYRRVDCSLVHAASGGHLTQIKWLVKHACWEQHSVGSALEVAAWNGFLETAQYLYGKTTEHLPISVYHNLFLMLQWLDGMDLVTDWRCMANSPSSKGDLRMLRWLHENEKPVCFDAVMDIAAGQGHLEVVQWLHVNRTEGCTTRAMDQAAGHGHLEMVQWLHNNREEGCTKAAMDLAAAGGHLNVLEWLHHNRSEGFSALATESSVMHNRLSVEILQWLYDHHKKNIDDVANNGNVEVVKWLHNTGEAVCTERAIDNAACGGYVEVMKFLSRRRLHQRRHNQCRE